MRIERVSNSPYTIFLTIDDVMERGFTTEDLWYDATRVGDLFNDMTSEARTEHNDDLESMLIVHDHLRQAQGMHVIVTQKTEEINWDEDYIEMKVTLDESNELIFAFSDFEDVIQVSFSLFTIGINGGTIYYWNGKYYMQFN